MKLSVHVKSFSKKREVTPRADGGLTVSLKAEPKEGKANTELIKVLSDYFSVPKKHIQIVSGLKAKTKIVEIK